MNMISQLPQPARFESVGERRLPVQVPIRLFTLSERVDNAKIENAMIVEAARLNQHRTHSRVEETFGDCRTNEKRSAECRAAILAQLDIPQTAQQIAASLGKGDATIMTRLKQMHIEGIVGFTEQPRGADGRPVGRIWRKVQAEPSSLQMRQDILNTLTKPMTSNQVAKALGRNARWVGKVMRDMLRDGCLERSKVGGSVAALWVRA